MAAAVLEHAPAAAERAVGARCPPRGRRPLRHGPAVRRRAGAPGGWPSCWSAMPSSASTPSGSAEALDAADRALGCWRREGDREREGALLGRRSWFLWGVGRSAEALESAAAGGGRAGGASHRPDRRWPVPTPGSPLRRMLDRDIPGAIEVGGRAIELAERFGQPEQLSRALQRGRFRPVVLGPRPGAADPRAEPRRSPGSTGTTSWRPSP